MVDSAQITLAPGWLKDQVEDAGHCLRRDHDPNWMVAAGMSVTLPIPKAEADELYRRLNQRFKAWTGKASCPPVSRELPNLSPPRTGRRNRTVTDQRELEDARAAGYDEGREALVAAERHYTDLFFAMRRAFQNWPAMPPPVVLKYLPGTFPEDGNRGKAIQREFGRDLVPYKTECEIGAGFWDRITNGAWRTVPRPVQPEGDGR